MHGASQDQEETGRDQAIADQTDPSTPDSPAAPASQTIRNDDPNENGEEEQARRRRRPFVFASLVLVALLLLAGGVYYWLSGRNVESTDDAFTDGSVVSVAPQVAGEVVSLDVTDNESVKAGQPIIHIDPAQYVNSRNQARGALDAAKSQAAGQQLEVEIAKKNFPALLQQAQAQLATAQANLTKAQGDYDRQRNLPKAATTQQEVDATFAAFQQAQAQVLQAQAQVQIESPVPQRINAASAQYDQLQGDVEQDQARLDQAELDLSRTVVKAPQDGWITRRNVDKGDYVMPGQQIVAIVTPQVWITANFKEGQLDRIRPGQKVSIKVDAYPHLDLSGHVDSIQLGTGAKFSAFPPENATGNFVKVVQRVPVKIVIDSGLDPNLPLPLGLSVEPTVTVQ